MIQHDGGDDKKKRQNRPHCIVSPAATMNLKADVLNIKIYIKNNKQRGFDLPFVAVLTQRIVTSGENTKRFPGRSQ